MDRTGSGARAPRTSARAIAVGLIAVPAAIALVQALAVEGEAVVGWLGMVPLVASLALGWRGVTATAVYSVVIAALLTLGQPGGSLLPEITRVAVVAGLGSFAVLNSWVRQRREDQLRELDDVARTAQAALRHTLPAQTRQWRLASRSRSSARRAEVGGDVLEVAETTTGVRALVADVSGRGLPAVRMATVTAKSFREACQQRNLPLAEIARRIDQDVQRVADDEEFVTAVLLDLDDRGWLNVVNCGHPPPLRLTSAGELQPLSPSLATTPLALAPSPTSDTYCMASGDRLLLYTDGLLEARDDAGDFFPLRAHAALLAGPDPQSAVDRLLAVVDQHAGGQLEDDITLLLIAPCGTSQYSHGSSRGTSDHSAPVCGGTDVRHT